MGEKQRESNGNFAKGNTLAAGAKHTWRKELLKAQREHFTADKITKVLEAMYRDAIKGNIKAQKEYLNRGLGKVTDKIDVTTDGEKLGITFIPAGAKKGLDEEE